MRRCSARCRLGTIPNLPQQLSLSSRMAPRLEASGHESAGRDGMWSTAQRPACGSHLGQLTGQLFVLAFLFSPAAGDVCIRMYIVFWIYSPNRTGGSLFTHTDRQDSARGWELTGLQFAWRRTYVARHRRRYRWGRGSTKFNNCWLESSGDRGAWPKKGIV